MSEGTNDKNTLGSDVSDPNEYAEDKMNSDLPSERYTQGGASASSDFVNAQGNTDHHQPYPHMPYFDKEQIKLQKRRIRQERRNDPQNKFTIKVIAICIAVAMIFGTGGGYLGAKFAGANTSGTAVLYQSVDRTAATDASGTGELSVAEVAALVSDSVVEITTEVVTTNNRLKQYVGEGAGSGVIVTADGYIVTNYHVIEDASTITVTLKDKSSYTATLIGTDEASDIAVLKIDAAGLTPSVLGYSDDLLVGETAIVIGNPLGELGGTVTSGIISALDREITIDNETMTLLQIDAAVNPGNSGGGLFNTQGELIGIVNAKSSGSGVEGLGFAIPINNVKAVIEDLISYGYVTGQIAMGVTLIDIDDSQSAMNYQVSDYGVYVVGVEDASNAQTAGIEVGDRIVSIDGTEVSSSSEVKTIIDSLSAGDKVTVLVSRDGKEVSLNMTMSETMN